MADPIVIMLLVAAAISVITGFIQGEPEWADAVIILSVVILNSVLGVVQEAVSEQALEALQEMQRRPVQGYARRQARPHAQLRAGSRVISFCLRRATLCRQTAAFSRALP